MRNKRSAGIALAVYLNAQQAVGERMRVPGTKLMYASTEDGRESSTNVQIPDRE